MSQNEQQQMIEEIKQEVALTQHLTGRGHLDPRVMVVMAEIPREAFVPEEMKHAAFRNGPIPIGHGQTISQPYIVALMTDLLQLQPDDKVLEIGTGSGYQTAILSRLCKQIYSVEVVPELSETAHRIFEDLGYDNIHLHVGNGHEGWPEYAPYDGIIVTAAARYIPQPLVDQLKFGGKLVIPVGEPHSFQRLYVVEKDNQGNILPTEILGVAFVPLVGREISGS
jgi:protein-L-isoaspartate(D-aspartate) O-methyltransferase